MMDPMSMYGSMMMNGHQAHSGYPMPGQYPMGPAASSHSPYDHYNSHQQQHHYIKLPASISQPDSSFPGYSNSMNFTDYDDEFGNYYMRAAGSSSVGKAFPLSQTPSHNFRRSQQQLDQRSAGAFILPTEEQEELTNNNGHGLVQLNKRSKRQANYYESSYGDDDDHKKPCYGFPLEVNVKSRIKMDQVFPIFGKSQFKKCIKLNRPLLPPVEDNHGPYHGRPY